MVSYDARGYYGHPDHIQAHRVRALAVTTETRAAVLPDVPTVSETVPGYAMSTWYGAVVPAKTSREIASFCATLLGPQEDSRLGVRPRLLVAADRAGGPIVARGRARSPD